MATKNPFQSPNDIVPNPDDAPDVEPTPAPTSAVGRMVHVTDATGKCVAAIVTDVLADGWLALTEFPSGQQPVPSVAGADEWHVPEGA